MVASFKFPPATRAERFTETINLAYPVADGNRFDLFNVADDLEFLIHLLIFSASTLRAHSDDGNPIRRQFVKLVNHFIKLAGWYGALTRPLPQAVLTRFV